MKLKTWFASLALVVSAAACGGGDNPTGPRDPGPPPPLPAGAVTVTTASGLQYVDVAVGTGAVAQVGNRVRVHYTGWLASNNQFFDTSAGGPPLEFILRDQAPSVIRGFDEGIRGMQVGGKRRLIIPPALGYGTAPYTDPRTGAVIIPGNSTLIFDVQLVTVS